MHGAAGPQLDHIPNAQLLAVPSQIPVQVVIQDMTTNTVVSIMLVLILMIPMVQPILTVEDRALLPLHLLPLLVKDMPVQGRLVWLMLMVHIQWLVAVGLALPHPEDALWAGLFLMKIPSPTPLFR